MKRSCTVLVAAAALAAFAVSAEAQESKFGIEVAGMYATLSGDDFQGTDAGMGFDAQGRFSINPAFSLGAGVQRTSHGIDGASNDMGVLGFFAEPRYAFAMEGSSMKPFISGRFAMLKASLEEGGSDFEQSGMLFGFGGGAGFMVSPTVQLTGSVTYNIVDMGDLEIDGTKVPDSEASGSSLAVRFGVSFTFR